MGQTNRLYRLYSVPRRTVLCGLAGLWLAGCTVNAVDAANRVNTVPRYTIIADPPGNRGTVTAKDSGVTLLVESRRGIGRLHLAWWTPTPPPLAGVELALTGLEHVALSWDDRTVSSAWTGDAPAWATLTDDRGTAAFPVPGDEDWPVVTRTPAGHFLFVPPPSFNTAAPIIWQVAWVDFYR